MLVTIPEEVIFLVLVIRTYPKLKKCIFYMKIILLFIVSGSSLSSYQLTNFSLSIRKESHKCTGGLRFFYSSRNNTQTAWLRRAERKKEKEQEHNKDRMYVGGRKQQTKNNNFNSTNSRNSYFPFWVENCCCSLL